MRPILPILAAGFSLALTTTALVRAADQSDTLLNQSTFADSEDATQVREEQAVERKDQAGDPAGAQANPGAAAGTAKAPAAVAPEAGARPAK